MNDEQESKNNDALWQSLGRVAKDQEPALDIDKLCAERPRHNLLDRCAGWVLNGGLPIFWWLGLGVLLLGFQGAIVKLVGALVLSLLASRPLSVLVRGAHGLELRRLVFWAVPLFLLVPWLFLPVDILHFRVSADPAGGFSNPLDVVGAMALQSRLEDILSPHIGWVFVMGLAGVFLARGLVQRHFPWAEAKAVAGSKAAAALLLLLSPWLCMLMLFIPDSQVSRWESEIGPRFSESVLAGSEEKNQRKVWGTLLEEASSLPEEETALSLSVLPRLEDKALSLLKTDPPESREEREDSFTLLQLLSWRAESLENPVAIEAAKALPVFDGIRDGFKPGIWLNDILPWLQSAERTEAELQQAQADVRYILEHLKSNRDELDSLVYHQVYGGGSVPTPTDSLLRSPKESKTIRETRSFRARPLKVGSFEVYWSPTRLLELERKRDYLKAWLAYRESHLGSERQGRHSTPKETVNMDREDFYRTRFSQVFNDRMRGILETAELYLRLRRETLKGERPTEALQRFAQGDPERWQITVKDEGAVLRDTRESYDVDWVFP